MSSSNDHRSKNSAGSIGERYHEPIGRTFWQLRMDSPRLKRKLMLSLAVEACNDTHGPNRVVLYAIVFWGFLSIRSHYGRKVSWGTLTERAHAAFIARKIMTEAHAQYRLRTLNHRSRGIRLCIFIKGSSTCIERVNWEKSDRQVHMTIYSP